MVESTSSLCIENRTFEADLDDAAFDDGTPDNKYGLAEHVVSELDGTVGVQQNGPLLNTGHHIDDQPRNDCWLVGRAQRGCHAMILPNDVCHQQNEARDY